MRRAALVLGLFGCASSPPPPPAAEPARAPSVEAPLAPSAFADVTRSPWVAPLDDPRAAHLASECGTHDGALARVAARLAKEHAASGETIDVDHALALMRASGEPHVRPRIVSTAGRAPLDDGRIGRELRARRSPESRCGVAFAAAPDGREVLVAIAVEALADLAPLPTRARTGQWLTFEATLGVPARSAKLVVLGPRGVPRTVPTAISRSAVRARFALDRPGDFTVQLVADLEQGPRPLLEARVFADVEPFPEAAVPAPGELEGEDADALHRMVAALRADEKLPALARDPRLDALALTHANEMRAKGQVAHDLGDGDLAERFQAESLAARVVGENVARARTLPLAHRALHASPSHRLNLLRPDYTHVGLAVAQDTNAVYVCEIFAASLR